MWDGIMLNVTRSKQNEEEIKRSRAQLSALASHVESVKEQERLNIAREIHDDLGGNLTAVKIGLSWLARHMPQGQSELREKAEYLDSVIDQTLDAAHRIASNMRPAIVDFGIVSAIEWQLKRFTLNLDIPFEFSSTHKQIPLDSDASIAVFRIVQEALTNIAKHARASRVGVRLEKLKDELHLEIVDDGVGPLPVRSRNHKKSFGILGMTERAAALGGKLNVSAAPGSGTVVSLQLPLAIPTPYVAHKHEKNPK
jgi:signal transduction histidine kinase